MNLKRNVGRRAAIITIAGSTALFTFAGAATAFVLGKGSTNGNAAATSSASHEDLVFVLGDMSDSALEPGESATATLTISNPNAYKTKIGSLEIVNVAVTGATEGALGTVNVSVNEGADGDVLAGANASDSDQTTAVVTVSISDSADVDQTSLLGKTVTFTVKTA